MATKQITAKWVNNPGKSKAGNTYYNIKTDTDEVYWAKAGQLDGINNGDSVEVVFTVDKKGGFNIVSAKGMTSSAGRLLKSFRQDESPTVVDGKCIHGLVVAYIQSGVVPLSVDGIRHAYKICADGYHAKGAIASHVVQSLIRETAQEMVDDEVPY